MAVNRRQFIELMGTVGATAVGARTARAAGDHDAGQVGEDTMGVLVDIPNCIGCRKCEFACQKAADFDVPPMESFDDKSVMKEPRRPSPDSYTVVNRYTNPEDEGKPVYAKVNCLHCNDPACVSACLVGALTKNDNGAVTYEPWKCMGCRYCMVACPFQIPTYDYETPLTPQVRKCTLCFEKMQQGEEVPGCVKICPQDCLTFGKRSDLLHMAHEKINAKPDVYIDHVYGEHEVGGTSWLYLSSVPFEELGFLKLGHEAPPRLVESIQHGIFKGFLPPIALFGLLGMTMWLSRRPREGPGGPKSEGAAKPESEEAPARPRRRYEPSLEPVAQSVGRGGVA